MTAVTIPANRITRIHGRGLLLSILEKELLLIRIKVLDAGRFDVQTEAWSSYWKPLYELNQSEIAENLNSLHSAWCNYVHSGFNSELRREYCFRYFTLLDSVLVNIPKTKF